MKHIDSWFRLSWPALVFVVSGCFQPGTGFEPNRPVDYSKLVPASGIVTVQGKPLANAVVMLMNSTGIPMVGETGEDGRFDLETGTKKGALPGKYQVTISYMVSPQGNPQGLGPRSAMVRSPEMLDAVERVPPEYSDLAKTKLTAQVGRQGATLSFDLPVTLEPPKPKDDSKGADETPAVGKDAEEPQSTAKNAGPHESPKTPNSLSDSAAKATPEPKPERSPKD
jgi:hypothetical protein